MSRVKRNIDVINDGTLNKGTAFENWKEKN